MNASLKPLERVRQQWNELGERDPLWAILTRPGKQDGGWEPAEFFQTGVTEIGAAINKAQQLSPLRFGTAVDFGCGVGRLTQALGEHFERVVGIDVAGSMIDAAIRFNRFPGRCEYIHNVAANLGGVADASVDLVYSSITLQHMVPELSRRYIGEFFRIARPGAQIIFQLPVRPRSRIWHWVKTIMPVVVTNFFWRLRTGAPEAIESYFISEHGVRRLVSNSGGAVALVESDNGGPPGWKSRRYFCLRTAD
jgi:SAM-dependent methyltransferase